MVTQAQNELLTRIEGDAPMGVMMRESFWIPAVLSAQVEADGAPVRVRLFGQDYVTFRATDGRIGFLDERCPHRNASLVLARNEDCALTCIFHGWKVDVTGQVVDAPTHSPNPDAFAAKIRVDHYPAHETGGIVWVWLGKGDPPSPPVVPWSVVPEDCVWVTATKAECNWLQGVEATIDSAHISVLHKTWFSKITEQDANNTLAHSLESLAPRYEVERTPYGLDAHGLRPMADGSTYLRTTKYILPFMGLTPGNSAYPGGGVIFVIAPVDDEHHIVFFGFWTSETPIAGGPDVGPQQHIVGDLPYDPFDFGRFTGTRADNFGQDREAMKAGHFTGFTGNLIQEDMVTQASMGPIVDRTKEHLSSSDVAIIHARRMLLEALDNFAAGKPPVAGGPMHDVAHAIPVDVLLPPAEKREPSSVS